MTEAETTDNFIHDNLPDADLEGFTFRIGTCQYSAPIVSDELTGNSVNDELYNSKLWVESRFNCKIENVDYGNYDNITDAVKNSVNAGDYVMDLQIQHDHNTADMAKAGYFYNIRSIEQFDFDQPWWPKFAIDQLTVCNRMYVGSTYLTYYGLAWERVLCVNKTLAENYGREIPYNTVRDGKWTLDAMFEFIADAVSDLDGDGKIGSADQVGYVSGSQTEYCLQESLQGSVYRKDENDVPQLTVNMERLTKMVEKMRWLYNDSGLFVADADFGQTMFKNGQALLSHTQIENAYKQYRESDVIYGFLPTPKLDETQESYINCCTDTPWAIPLTVTHPDEIGYVIEALSCYNYNNVVPAYFEVAIKTRLSDSPDDAEMLQLIADTRTIGFAYFYSLPFNNIISDLKSRRMEIASYVEKFTPKAETRLGELIAAFEGMDA